jgi:hypothetical protein
MTFIFTSKAATELEGDRKEKAPVELF